MLDAPQGSDAWFASRRGKVSSSRIAAVLSEGRNGGLPVTRYACMDDIIAERVLGVTVNSGFESEDTRWGTNCEAEARSFYEFKRNVDVELVGFIDHPTIPMSGSSPDGLVGDDGFVEIKCPKTNTHIETWRKNYIPPKYTKQILWQAACMPERKWADFISYDPRSEPEKRIVIKRMVLDEAVRAEIAWIEDKVRRFMIAMEPIEARVRAYVDRLNRRAA